MLDLLSVRLLGLVSISFLIPDEIELLKGALGFDGTPYFFLSYLGENLLILSFLGIVKHDNTPYICIKPFYTQIQPNIEAKYFG